MAVSVFQWMQMPASQVIKIHSPNSFVLLNKGKGYGAGEFVEVDLQKTIFLEYCTSLKDKDFGFEIDFFNKVKACKRT